MRADIVYVKLPISQIIFQKTDEDVAALKESIKSYGLLQPIGVVAQEDGYRLIFGHRRLQACIELGKKYVHTVLLTVRADEEKLFNLIENIHRSSKEFLCLCNKEIPVEHWKSALCLTEDQTQLLKSIIGFSEEEKKLITPSNTSFAQICNGDKSYFDRMCQLQKDIPDTAREKIRLTVLSDRRIFINEIKKITDLMILGGYGDFIYEDDNKIVIHKHTKNDNIAI